MKKQLNDSTCEELMVLYQSGEYLAFEEVTRPLENGVFVPGSYNYPSMVFDIGTLALLPRTIPFLVRTAKESTPYYNQPYHEIVPKQRVAPLVAFVAVLLRTTVILKPPALLPTMCAPPFL